VLVTNAETPYDYVESRADRALDRMLSRYRGADRIEAVYQAIGDGAQLLEDLAFDVLVSTTIADATGDALDQWGAVVGVDRQGARDREYRRYIRAQVLVNKSLGSVDELTEIYETLTEPSRVLHNAHHPSGFRLTAYRADYLPDRAVPRVKRIMDRSKPAGKAMSLVESLTEPDVAGTGTSIARTL
jgi:hypothetical protein